MEDADRAGARAFEAIVPMRDGPNGKLTKGIEVAQKIRKR